jgi:hypothetical protein
VRTHFRHLCLNIFSTIWRTLQSNEFWLLQSPSENLKVHQDSNSQSGSSLGNVKVLSLTLSYTPGSMKCDSQASLLARTFASPYLGCEPKARVVTLRLELRFNFLAKGDLWKWSAIIWVIKVPTIVQEVWKRLILYKVFVEHRDVHLGITPNFKKVW